MRFSILFSAIIIASGIDEANAIELIQNGVTKTIVCFFVFMDIWDWFTNNFKD